MQSQVPCASLWVPACIAGLSSEKLIRSISAQHRPRLSPQITWKHCSKSHAIFCMPGNFGCMRESHPALYSAPLPPTAKYTCTSSSLHTCNKSFSLNAYLQSVFCVSWLTLKIRGLVCPLHRSLSPAGLLSTCRFPDHGGCSDCWNSYFSCVAA